jgi:TPP-dependent pyruvate/acetoin dehydrogenase alpha subunit
MGTAIRFTHSVQQLEKKGEAYGISSEAVDGMDLLAVMDAAAHAVETIKKTGKPYFLVCNTYRFRAHSMFDAELYREKSEVEEWKKKDPIPKFKDFLLKENLISEAQIAELESGVEEVIQNAIAFAEDGTWEATGDLTKFVYSENQSR